MFFSNHCIFKTKFTFLLVNKIRYRVFNIQLLDIWTVFGHDFTVKGQCQHLKTTVFYVKQIPNLRSFMRYNKYYIWVAACFLWALTAQF